MQFERLYNSLFPKTETGDSTDFEKLLDEYPYFGVAHFFRLRESKRRGPSDLSLDSRAALYFNNPFLLDYQLNWSLQMTDKVREGQAMPVQVIPPSLRAVGESQVESAESNTIFSKAENQEESTGMGIKEPPGGKAKAEVTSKIEEEQLFEPLHTTDYFASQGIKMSEEVQPTDKLGIQLRSFTQWLKTMKKVHESKLPEGSEQLDASVNTLAEKSNLEIEVVTEAMADAFLLQGKRLKAKDIYLKLSLLNPSKNAYFAAKLEQIT